MGLALYLWYKESERHFRMGNLQKSVKDRYSLTKRLSLLRDKSFNIRLLTNRENLQKDVVLSLISPHTLPEPIWQSPCHMFVISQGFCPSLTRRLLDFS